MQSIRIPYKQDAFGNPIHARVSWSTQTDSKSRPIAIAYHGGGLLVGSSEIIPKAQTEYFAERGYVVVAPNYRLCPQVVAREAVADCVEAYEWAVSLLPALFKTEHGVELDSDSVVTWGHSTGCTLAMLVGMRKSVKAVTAFYPTLFAADTSSTPHQPSLAPPFGSMPDYEPPAQDWASITPPGEEISESPLAIPGTVPPPRNRWQGHLLKKGLWLSTICPDGGYEVLDPLSRVDARWPPIMIVQGDADSIPGSEPGLARRACEEMIKAGVKEVELETVNGANHMFDLQLTDADVTPGWSSVVKGLDWLRSHI